MCLYPETPIRRDLQARSVPPTSCQLLTASQDAHRDGLSLGHSQPRSPGPADSACSSR